MFCRSVRGRVLSLGCAVYFVAAGLLCAQDRTAQERRREEWQIEWLVTLQPMESRGTPGTGAQATSGEQPDPRVTITLEDFRKLTPAGAVTIVDVRDADVFAAGHIPGALSIPLGTVGRSVERLRKLGKPVVTYCS